MALKEICNSPPNELAEIIQGNPFDGITFIHYFTDGARQHFKSRNAMWFLGHHEEIFGVRAAWNFHASGHGKSACDGIGACLKSQIRRKALRETYSPDTAPI